MPAPKNPQLERFIDDAIDRRFRTSSALADAIGMSLSAFSRGIREEGTISTENCLELAKVLSERPAKILRLARRKRVAELLEQLHPTLTLSPDEEHVVELWRRIKNDEAKLDLCRSMLETMAHAVMLELAQKTAARAASASGPGRPTKKKKDRTPNPAGVGGEERSLRY
jgi:hypothetical protein